MGKNIVSQKRGRGSLTYRSPPNFMRLSSYNSLNNENNLFVEDIIHVSGKNSPIMVIKGKIKYFFPCINGISVNQKIIFFPENQRNYFFSLDQLPIGTSICGIQSQVFGKITDICSGGTFGIIIKKEKKKIYVRLPSKKIKIYDEKCFAMKGSIAGGGRIFKKILKAGGNYFKLKGKAKKNRRVSGVAMNVNAHPHGGGNHQHIGFPNTVSKATSPGRKVGRFGKMRNHKKLKKYYRLKK